MDDVEPLNKYVSLFMSCVRIVCPNLIMDVPKDSDELRSWIQGFSIKNLQRCEELFDEWGPIVTSVLCSIQPLESPNGNLEMRCDNKLTEYMLQAAMKSQRLHNRIRKAKQFFESSNPEKLKDEHIVTTIADKAVSKFIRGIPSARIMSANSDIIKRQGWKLFHKLLHDTTEDEIKRLYKKDVILVSTDTYPLDQIQNTKSDSPRDQAIFNQYMYMIRIFRSALFKKDPMLGKIFQYSRLENLPTREIAQKLNIPIADVTSKKKKLKRELDTNPIAKSLYALLKNENH